MGALIGQKITIIVKVCQKHHRSQLSQTIQKEMSTFFRWFLVWQFSNETIVIEGITWKTFYLRKYNDPTFLTAKFPH